MPTIPVGALLVLTTGPFSEYTVHGIFVALKELNQRKLYDLFIESEKADFTNNSRRHLTSEKFLDWLRKEQYISPVNSYELYIGSYELLTSYDEATER